MRLLASLSVAALLLCACGGISAGTSLAPDASPIAVPGSKPAPDPSVPGRDFATASTSPAAASTTTRSPGPSSPAEVDLVSYIEVIEHLLVGTTYEGMALESPHVFLATGALFCDRLDAGTSSDEVLFDYIESLTGAPADQASDDVLTMAGAVLGSGLATMCPHHIATIGISD